jgi:hypothetical protein
LRPCPIISAPLPPGEAQRLAALNDTALLDAPSEPSFDDLTRLASLTFGAPIAAISLADRGRQWF